jgi:RNA polymerase sigma-70 factor, ECF subfamily
MQQPMDDHQQREVAQGLREGRIDAWHALYEAYSRPIWHAVARLLGPGSTDVADVVQETFLAAARSARGYDPVRGSLGLWLAGIARKHVAIHHRQHHRQERIKEAADRLGESHQQVVRWLCDREAAPPDALATAELATLVRATLGGLPTDYEVLLTAKYLDEMSVEQIAAEHRSTTTAVRSKLARARRAFRDVFANIQAGTIRSERLTGGPRKETP